MIWLPNTEAMAIFPQLKSGAVMQYPATRTLSFANTTVRFVDGTEQRFRGSGAALKTWAIRLDLLDEAEAAALESFFTANQGAFGSFAFTDPWDGSEYPDCSIDQDVIAIELGDEMRARTQIVVRQNRS